MDSYTPALLKAGVAATIGKGNRSIEVMEAIKQYSSVYFCAIGGAGALAAKCVCSCEEIAFFELGCESIKKLFVRDFPVIVGVDCHNGNLFNKKPIIIS